MTPVTIGLLALGMSVDAFAAALGQGANARRRGLGALLATGAIFGLVEALTPLIGWALGVMASYAIAAVDHWVAFGLLAAVGLRTIAEALRPAPAQEAPRRLSNGWLRIVATAVGTSIDAMAVGVSLAFVDMPILAVAAAIGVTTTAMALLGLGLGRRLGQRFGRGVELVGGLVLIGVGATILVEHLRA